MKTLVVYVPGRNNYNFDFLPEFKGSKVNYIELEKANRIRNFDLFKEKMAFAREEGCNNLSISGYGEPMLNQAYLEMIDTLNKQLINPFSHIELKTNGSTFLKENSEDLDFLSHTGIKTIVLYLTSFEDFKHFQLITGGGVGVNNKEKIDINLVCEKIKSFGFNLRLEMLLSKWLEYMTIDDIANYSLNLKPDQVTLTKMISSNEDYETTNWIKNNGCQSESVVRLQEALNNLKPVGITSVGYNIYSINNMSFVLKDGTKNDENFNNMYLLPNAKIYSQPDDLGSLIY